MKSSIVRPFPAVRLFSAGGGSSVRLLLLLSLLIPIVPVYSVDIVAVTRSGQRLVVAEVDATIRTLELSMHNTNASLSDPVIGVEGLELLPDLFDLRIYHAPQIVDFAFLADAPTLEKLVISFARVRNIGFLSSLPLLRFMMLEFCDDWESRGGLPFLEKPIDLTNNRLIEFIGLRVCGLTIVPRFWNPPGTFEYLDLSYNSISLNDPESPSLSALGKLTAVFVDGNQVSSAVVIAYPNVTIESADPTVDGYLR